jgi:hypothetical protein
MEWGVTIYQSRLKGINRVHGDYVPMMDETILTKTPEF